MSIAPSPSYRITLRVRYANKIGSLAALTAAVAEAGGSLGCVHTVESDRAHVTRDLTVDAASEEHAQAIAKAVRALPGVKVESVTDETFRMHLGGKLEVTPTSPLVSGDDLSMAYTPGVARVSNFVAKDRDQSFNYTIRKNTVAVVSDGSAVLGLGNIGPEGAMPVMEGKAILFKEFGGVDAFPICVSTQDADEIIAVVKAIAPTFGGINLEDISAPRCFAIEEKLREELDIPVFHDDQHGTAAVIIAALLNASKLVNKSTKSMKVVIAGAGAAGVACTKALLNLGIADAIVCDRNGAIHKGRAENMNFAKEWLAENTNKSGFTGSVKEALRGADLFLGVSGPNLLSGEDISTMADGAIVFALSNPVPEVMPEEAAPYVAVMATGRSDYPNQINNVLCFPGLFRGLLDSGATKVVPEMVVAAGRAIASMIQPSDLTPDYIIPSVFDRRVAPAVADAVAKVARDAKVTRKTPKPL
ncbi:MAG: malic enzyme-like NAD(P)-binding protein [Armatimonadota bacterium]